MKKLLNTTASLLNIGVLVGITAFGAFNIKEAQAETALRGISQEDKVCLQQNIFFEARNQSTLGQVAVAWVTLNRMKAARYPDSICGVVKQGHTDANGNMIRNKCQFSWYCDGRSDTIPDNIIAQRAWEDAGIVAEVVLLDWLRGKISPVENSTMYHADYVNPYWASSFDMVTKIDDHIFYEKEL